MRLAVILALVVGVSVALQANLTSVARRTLGPVVMVALTEFATTAAGISLFQGNDLLRWTG